MPNFSMDIADHTGKTGKMYNEFRHLEHDTWCYHLACQKLRTHHKFAAQITKSEYGTTIAQSPSQAEEGEGSSRPSVSLYDSYDVKTSERPTTANLMNEEDLDGIRSEKDPRGGHLRRQAGNQQCQMEANQRRNVLNRRRIADYVDRKGHPHKKTTPCEYWKWPRVKRKLKRNKKCCASGSCVTSNFVECLKECKNMKPEKYAGRNLVLNQVQVLQKWPHHRRIIQFFLK